MPPRSLAITLIWRRAFGQVVAHGVAEAIHAIYQPELAPAALRLHAHNPSATAQASLSVTCEVAVHDRPLLAEPGNCVDCSSQNFAHTLDRIWAKNAKQKRPK
jgi:hypothetical protein